MKSSTRYALVAALFAVGATGSYVAGVAVGKARSTDAAAAILASAQADLGLSHVLRLRELKSDLARGCSSEALTKVQFDLDTQMSVLSSLYREHKGTWVVESIAKRDPSMPAQLETFHLQYDSWTEPKCTR